MSGRVGQGGSQRIHSARGNFRLSKEEIPIKGKTVTTKTGTDDAPAERLTSAKPMESTSIHTRVVTGMLMSKPR